MDAALIERIVRDVVRELTHASPAAAPRCPSTQRPGVFTDVAEAVAAVKKAQQAFAARPLRDRAAAVEIIRRLCREQAEEWGRMEFEETRIGRLDHKIEKLKVAADHVPGVEFLQTHAKTGSDGLSLTEYAPFGVIVCITPVTHSLPTLAGNAINMLAGGNALLCNPHPAGAKIACAGVARFNREIEKAIGISPLIGIMAEPTLATAQAMFDHRDVDLLCVTGGPAVARAALRSSKKAIVAGPGNPPVVVDETADLDLAARSILRGAAYDNNLLCIAEKEVFVVESVFPAFMSALQRAGAMPLDERQIAKLTAAAFVAHESKPGRVIVNKDCIGQDPFVLGQKAGLTVPKGTELLFGETAPDHPFVDHEQMMPFVPIVRAKHFDQALEWAIQYEHGFRHTAILHSRNLERMSRMSQAMQTTLFVVNGPCTASLGVGGEGYLSYSIATPTGEGVTNPLTFMRQRRINLVGGFGMV